MSSSDISNPFDDLKRLGLRSREQMRSDLLGFSLLSERLDYLQRQREKWIRAQEREATIAETWGIDGALRFIDDETIYLGSQLKATETTVEEIVNVENARSGTSYNTENSDSAIITPTSLPYEDDSPDFNHDRRALWDHFARFIVNIHHELFERGLKNREILDELNIRLYDRFGDKVKARASALRKQGNKQVNTEPLLDVRQLRRVLEKHRRGEYGPTVQSGQVRTGNLP